MPRLLFIYRTSLCDIYSRVAFINGSSPERQSLEKLSIDTTELEDSGPFADVEGKNCSKYLSLFFLYLPSRRHIHVLRASRIVGVAQLLFKSSNYFVQHFRTCRHYSRAVSDRANMVYSPYVSNMPPEGHQL